MKAIEKQAQEGEKLSLEELYETYRPLLFSIAYRMLGARADAEDIVQDTFAAAASVDRARIGNMKSYLCQMTINRSLNELKSARKTREQYIGPWLPEPLVGREAQPSEAAELHESLSYAFLVLLDRLSPRERAVFLLRSAYGLEYSEIAGFLHITDIYCRKLYSSAKKRIGAGESLQEDHRAAMARRQQLERFISAFQQGDVQKLLALLKEEAILVTDGGGRVKAALKPIYTRRRVVTLLEVIASRGLYGSEARIMMVNGREEVLFYKEGQVVSVFCFEWSLCEGEERIQTIYCIKNPDKL